MTTWYLMRTPILLSNEPLGVEIEVTLCAHFGRDRADNSVGLPESITISASWCESPNGGRMYGHFDEQRIEALCWQWLAEQEPPYWEHEE